MSEKVKVWVDADACPKVMREILFKAAQRVQVETTFVANQLIPTPPSPFLKSKRVEAGFDVADNEIVRLVQKGDLVITQDIPLAAEVIDKGADALHPRGEMFSKETIKAKLNIRDFNETLRASGIQTGRTSTLGNREKQAFANQLDAWLARNAR
jgi:uncharacterized protein YaiI (UPF0178 family)